VLLSVPKKYKKNGNNEYKKWKSKKENKNGEKLIKHVLGANSWRGRGCFAVRRGKVQPAAFPHTNNSCLFPDLSTSSSFFLSACGL